MSCNVSLHSCQILSVHSTTLQKYYNIYYPGQGNMFTTLALFVLKLEMMLLFEIVITLFWLLLL